MKKEDIAIRAEYISEVLEQQGIFTDGELMALSLFRAISGSVGGFEELISGKYPEEFILAYSIMNSDEFDTASKKILGGTK